MNFIVIIPARYGSTRFPGKPLVDIAGKPMIAHVVERAMQANAENVFVATDDDRIADCVKGFGGQVVMTRTDHQSGTERLAEVVENLKCDDETIVVNVQGDEPHVPVDIIQQVARNLHEHPEAVMATLGCPITAAAEFYNPNVVKVVTDCNGLALYFSRSPLPYVRDAMLDGNTTKSAQDSDIDFAQYGFMRHIGIYAYRAGFIKQYISMEATPLEQIESLEQLRVLYHGFKIHVDKAVATPPPGIDTPEDLAKLMG